MLIAMVLITDRLPGNPWVLVLLGIGLAILVSSLVEYWLHRLMHWQPDSRLGDRHRDHHRRNEGQGVLGEFRDYVKGSAIAMLLPLFLDRTFGLSWLIGALGYALFSAYAHQLQHENAIHCGWMAMPVHYVHHKYGMWHHNFGLGVDWWDRLFGTYKPMDWLGDEERSHADQPPWQIRWR